MNDFQDQQISRRLNRRARASVRYLRLIFAQFWRQGLTIALLLFLGALAFHRCPIDALGRKPDWFESLFATYSLFALQPVYPLPPSWPLRIVYFSYPLLGLLVVADTVVRVALLLFSRQENQKEWTKVLASTYRDHIILCGLGRVGYRILERLLEWHLDVVVIEKSENSPFAARMQHLGVPLLMFDARQEESLALAGIKHARTLIIATNDDLANVEIALDGRRLNPKVRVVLRMFDENIATKLRDAFHLDVAFSSAAVAAPLVAASVLDLEILGTFSLDGREIFTAKLTLEENCQLVGFTIAEMRQHHKVMVLSHKRPDKPLIYSPPGTEKLGFGDSLVVHGELPDLRRLGKLTRNR